MILSQLERVDPRINRSLCEDQLRLLAASSEFQKLLGTRVEVKRVGRLRATFEVDDVLVALVVAPTHSLDLRTSVMGKPTRWTQLVRVYTDFSQYWLYTCDDQDGQLRLKWRGQCASFEAVLRSARGVVGLAHDLDWSVVSRSVAVELPPRSRLCRTNRATGRRGSTPRNLKHLVARGFTLENVEQVSSRLLGSTPYATEDRADGRIVTRLKELPPLLAPAADFTGKVSTPRRGDYVASYVSKGDREAYREYAVCRPTSSTLEESLEQLQYSILHLLAVRRTKLFRARYASRLFTVALPAGLLRNLGDPDASLAVVPSVTLTKLPHSSRFRSTLGITLAVFPVTVDPDGRASARKPTHGEVSRITDSLGTAGGIFKPTSGYTLEGPLADYVSERSPEWTCGALYRAVASATCAYAAGRRDDTTARARAVVGLRQSTMGSVCYLVDWHGSGRIAWDDWCAGKDDLGLAELMHRAIFPTDHEGGPLAASTSASVDFRSLSIGNAHGADMSGLTIFNPQNDTKYVLFPLEAEDFPNSSILRWFTWQMYLDVALASVRSLLGRFHDGVDTTTDLRRVLRSVQRLTAELAEVYDLDLSDFFYRREYEALRSVLRLDADHAYMRDRLSSAQGESSLREQILMNNLVLALTISGVAGTVIVAVGQSKEWSVPEYVGGTLIALSASLLVSFGLLEPCRRLVSRIKSSLVARRR